MQFTSALAQAWIDYCLLVISHALAQSQLNLLADTTHADIRMLFEDQLIDEDERAWAVQTINDALQARGHALKQALKEPPKP